MALCQEQRVMCDIYGKLNLFSFEFNTFSGWIVITQNRDTWWNCPRYITGYSQSNCEVLGELLLDFKPVMISSMLGVH